MSFKKFGVLLASLLVALAPWGQTLGSWESALTTSNLWPALGIVGGVILAWLSESPVRPR